MQDRKALSFDLYVVTDDSFHSHVDVAKSAYDGGADAVQLRVKDGNPHFLDWAKEIASYSKSKGRIFIVNDSVDVALESGADGVHLGQSDESVSEVRARVGKDFIIGASVGSAGEAVEAEKNGATYVALSPVFDTSTKKDAGRGHGLEVLSEISERVSVPVVAIGGINMENAADVIRSGACGIAVISAVSHRKDVEKAASEMKNIVRQAKIASLFP